MKEQLTDTQPYPSYQVPLWQQPMPWYLTVPACMVWIFLIALAVTLLLQVIPAL